MFFRTDELKEHVTLYKWFILTIVEMVVGPEIIESIVTTGSVPPFKTIVKDDSYKFGAERHLTLHIPSGIVTNILRPIIIELLYYKFHKLYLILEPTSEPYVNENTKTVVV